MGKNAYHQTSGAANLQQARAFLQERKYLPNRRNFSKVAFALLSIFVLRRSRLEATPMGRWLTITVLFGLLALVGWMGYRLWNLVDIDMPTWAWAALAFGVGLSLLVGCGLMALLFYSSRKGYDEPPHTLDNPSADE